MRWDGMCVDGWVRCGKVVVSLLESRLAAVSLGGLIRLLCVKGGHVTGHRKEDISVVVAGERARGVLVAFKGPH